MNESKIKIKLPEAWKWEKLEDALDFVIGGDWGKDEGLDDPSYGNALCIRGSEFKNWDQEKGRTASLRKIKLSNIEKRKLIEGDILVEISGGGPEQPVGRTVLIDRTVLSYKPEIPKICTNFLRLIRPKDFVDSKFLNLYLKHFYYSGEIVRYQGGSNNLRNLKFSDYIKIKFPLPPKPTQQAIVSKIEELFSELDKGIEQLKATQQQLKIYRRAVLKWAFEGKLTNENANEKILPDGWKYTKIEEVAECLDSKRKPVNKVERLTRQGNIPYFGANGRTGWINDFLFNEPLVLVVEDETFVGRELPFSYKITGKSWVNNHAHILKPKKGLNIDYLNYQLAYYPFLPLTTGTTGRKKLTKNALMNAPIKICSSEEQEQIVSEIERRLSVADKIEEAIRQSLQQGEVLRQAILKKAFEGKLVTYIATETIGEVIKVIPRERKILAGKIIQLFHTDKHFGLTKFQKILYLVENFAELPYETNFIQETAGPYDRAFTSAFRNEMKEKNWALEESKRGITKLITSTDIDSLVNDYAAFFSEKNHQIDFVIQQLQHKSTHDAELVATLYAVWNNRLIKNKPIKIELLIEDFFNWSAKKKEKFLQEEIVITYNWMKKIKLIPSGFGKAVEAEV